MPYQARTHEQNRLKNCFFCSKKADREYLSDREISFIRANIFSEFEIYKDYLPGGTCGTCRAKVSRNLPFEHKNYFALINEMSALLRLRSGGPCQCTYCRKGRESGSTPSPAPPAPSLPPPNWHCPACRPLP